MLSDVACRCMRAPLAIALVLAVGAFGGSARAQTADELEARMVKEKVARKDCKVLICDIARNKKAEGGDVACDVVKTWTATELKENLLKGKVDWPWGNAQCKANIHLERKALAQVLAGGEAEAKLQKHTVSCALDQKEGTDKYTIAFSIEPVVKFDKGKAVKANLHWSGVEGSALAKGAVWSATALDNNLGILEGAVVKEINDFFAGKCDEVKDELSK